MFKNQCFPDAVCHGGASNYSGRSKVSVWFVVLGYCRNKAVQRGDLHGQRPAPYVDINGTQRFLLTGDYTLKKKYLYNIQLPSISPPKSYTLHLLIPSPSGKKQTLLYFKVF